MMDGFHMFTAITFCLALFVAISIWLTVLPSLGLLWAMGWL